MLEELKRTALRANLMLKELSLVCFTWGNASGIDRQSNLVVIKPRGVEYDRLSLEDMAVVDLDGNTVEGTSRKAQGWHAIHLRLTEAPKGRTNSFLTSIMNANTEKMPITDKRRKNE